MAKPRAGAPKLAGKPFLDNSVALDITIAGAVGIVTTFFGLTRL
jgi:hypothetical protein